MIFCFICKFSFVSISLLFSVDLNSFFFFGAPMCMYESQVDISWILCLSDECRTSTEHLIRCDSTTAFRLLCYCVLGIGFGIIQHKFARCYWNYSATNEKCLLIELNSPCHSTHHWHHQFNSLRQSIGRKPNEKCSFNF